ncbi:ribosome-associated protein [Pseudopedobacter saltans DSM 12145]|uniref:Ribosome-associated protein n=1 Tax=Pseudopedobacter saltans (strain ATCC 51119 / DSM 12145 / JCM 21818 / CCUG 39354 / LMG 10337 / NBRC 100064 / NCIMB 13643) TaxID=762903 RepID=F0S845_PSESL|nr:HPF/RaiA family ribosome-associated protein [Pseudopedobacter saltans]ADY52307.1 ribosome-associated protein [Pseudopedobacter saltans DSM 12145]
MKIQVNTDKNINGKESLANYVKTTIEENLNRFDELITRVDVHLSDDNANKEGAADKRCLIEVKAENIPSVAVSTVEETLHKAINVAIEKMKKTLSSKLEKLHDNKR